MALTVGSLFAGIGGFDLGFERAGFEVRWQVEIDDYATRVLEKHWRQVKRLRDVRECGRNSLEPVDVVVGGFPCQDISPSGRRAGIDGARSGLWREFARLVGELRPRYVVVENSADLLVRGMGRVCGDLAALGYDAEWEVVSACAFGAPHTRERLFLVAYPCGDEARAGRRPSDAAPRIWRKGAADPGERGGTGRTAWTVEPDLARVAYGLPCRLDRQRGLGNAVVPQVAEWIARRIADAEGMTP